MILRNYYSIPTLSALLIIIGIFLLAVSHNRPIYNDPQEAQRLLSINYAIVPNTEKDNFTQDWFIKMDKLRTDKYPLLDMGINLITTAISLVILSIISKDWTFQAFKNLKTPPKRTYFILLGSVGWIGLHIAELQMLTIDFKRGEFPWWADSLAIPMTSIYLSLMITLPILILIGTLLLCHNPTLPISLWVWDHSNRLKSSIWSVLYGIGIICIAVMMYGNLTHSTFLHFPVYFLGIYIMLSARAAAIGHKKQKNNTYNIQPT